MYAAGYLPCEYWISTSLIFTRIPQTITFFLIPWALFIPSKYFELFMFFDFLKLNPPWVAVIFNGCITHDCLGAFIHGEDCTHKKERKILFCYTLILILLSPHIPPCHPPLATSSLPCGSCHGCCCCRFRASRKWKKPNFDTYKLLCLTSFWQVQNATKFSISSVLFFIGLGCFFFLLFFWALGCFILHSIYVKSNLIWPKNTCNASNSCSTCHMKWLN